MSPQDTEVDSKRIPIDERIRRLERRANVIRSRLLRKVDALDARRHQVSEAAAVVKAEAPRIGLAVLGVLAVAAGSILAVRAIVKSRKERVLSFRAKRVLDQFRVQKKPPFALEVLQKLTMTIATIVATETTRRALKDTVDGRATFLQRISELAHARHTVRKTVAERDTLPA